MASRRRIFYIPIASYRRLACAACLLLLFAARFFGQTQTQTVTLTFEGLKDNESVLNYYNDGLGGDQTGPGPNDGVVFGADALAIISEGAGGTGNFSGNPSGNTIVFFLNGPGVIMNVPAGFTNGFSFYYSSANNTGTIYVYDGLNATGNLLATVNLPPTGTPCNGSMFTFSCWNTQGVTFTGVAKSVNFSGVANEIGFDNITLGSSTPGGAVNIITNALPNGTQNTAYPSTTLQASGGQSPYTWSATGLPTGLTLSAAGVLSGTPTQSGTFSVVVNVKDSSSTPLTGTKTFPLTIAGSVTITTSSLPAGTQGVAYPSTTLQAQGGQTPYIWSATGLPTGLSLSQAGVLSGTPTVSGPFSVVVTVKDGSSPQLTGTATLSLTIGAATTPLAISTSSLPGGTQNSAYPSATLQAQGGTPPYTWTESGSLDGLTLSSAGVLSGTPTSAGSFPVTFTVTDSAKQSVSLAVTIVISPAPLQGVTVTQNTNGTAPNQANLQVGFGQAATSALTGTLTLTFKPDPTVTNVPSNYVDPAGGFPASTQGSTQLTSNISIAAGQTSGSVVFGQGTVAGTWTVTLTALNSGGFSVLPSPAPSVTVVVPVAAPVVNSGTAKIINPTSSGFTVQLNGYATARKVSSASFTFTPAAGAQLQGTSATVQFNGVDQSQWFNTDAGRSAGGTFSLQVPFSYTGDPTALGSVSVTLN
jgi:putative Ig domain-containing protein